MKRKCAFILTFLMIFTIQSIHADEIANSKIKAKKLVKKAIEAIGNLGEEEAFILFSDKTSEFVDGEYYIFVVDFEGVTLAHGGNPALVGKNLSPLKDPDGVFFIQEFIKMAKEKGQGWVNYKWSNPETKKVEKKTSFIQAVKGANYFIGCGIYLK